MVLRMSSLIGLPYGEQWPGQDRGTDSLRSGEVRKAASALGWAVVACILRGALAPLYVRYFGNPLSITQPSQTQIISSSVMCLAIFLLAMLAVRIKPVFSCLVATLGFAAVCWIDFHQTPDLIEAGIISKSILLCLLAWATMNAIFSRVM